VSDDIPLIFAVDRPAPSAVFLSASGPAQMQQYATAGWRVLAAPGFTAARPVVLAEVPATALADDADVAAPVLASVEIEQWTVATPDRLARWRPALVKLNAAFSEVEPASIAAAAAALARLMPVVLGAHWRDDNGFRIRSLNRIDLLSALQPPEWRRLDLIGCADEATARTIVRIGRLHAGQEQRIAQLRVSEAVRGEHIARLEAALIAAQRSPYFTAPPS
jgi:hypothetical protein